MFIRNTSVVGSPRRAGLAQVLDSSRGTALILIAVLGSNVAPAAGATGAPADEAQVRVPASVQAHLELAALYREKAAEATQQAEAVRKKLAAELRGLPPDKTRVELPWVAKLRKEHDREIAQSEDAAREAQRFADYHFMRAREIEGLEFSRLKADDGGRK